MRELSLDAVVPSVLRVCWWRRVSARSRLCARVMTSLVLQRRGSTPQRGAYGRERLRGVMTRLCRRLDGWTGQRGPGVGCEKAISRGLTVIIMDKPTAHVSSDDTPVGFWR